MRRNGLEMLQAADAAFTEMDVKAFLTYGCLLGAYRDHGFISYDPDIDLGVLSDEIPADINEHMAKHGFQLYRSVVMDDRKTIAETTYIYKGIHLDVFHYYREGDDFYSIIQRKHETKEWKEANATDGFPCDRSYVPACEMERRDFLGLQIWMPIDTDGWLRAIYSDSYMTPIKNWDVADGYVTRIIKTKNRTYRLLY
ncbi:MAG: LicD family protein [Paludibacteraceae bacterium]|nr:LicD family protein [Paludibacteraceae bacterium]